MAKPQIGDKKGWNERTQTGFIYEEYNGKLMWVPYRNGIPQGGHGGYDLTGNIKGAANRLFNLTPLGTALKLSENLKINTKKNKDEKPLPHFFPFTTDTIDRNEFSTSQEFLKNQLKVDTNESKINVTLTPNRNNTTYTNKSNKSNKWKGSNINPPKEHWDEVKNPWFTGRGKEAEETWNEALEVLKTNHEAWLRKNRRIK